MTSVSDIIRINYLLKLSSEIIKSDYLIGLLSGIVKFIIYIFIMLLLNVVK